MIFEHQALISSYTPSYCVSGTLMPSTAEQLYDGSSSQNTLFYKASQLVAKLSTAKERRPHLNATSNTSNAGGWMEEPYPWPAARGHTPHSALAGSASPSLAPAHRGSSGGSSTCSRNTEQ